MKGSVDEPPFDAVAFMDQLAKINEDHQKVVALRPSEGQLAGFFEHFGDVLAEFGEASRAVSAEKRGLDPAQTFGWFAFEGSVAEADEAFVMPYVERFCEETRLSYHWLETNPTRSPVAWGLEYVARCFRTTAENIAAIGVLGASGRHLRAPLTLMRSVIEASAAACFLMDVRVTERERLRRVLNLHLAQTKESLLESSGGPHEGQYQTELNEVMEFATSCGFVLKRYRPLSWAPPQIAAEDGQPSDSTRAIIDEVLPGLGSSIWRNLSAVAHSRGAQTLLYDEFTPVQNLREWQRAEVVARHGVAALVVMRELCTRIESYLGWDFQSWLGAIDGLIRQSSVAAGMADAEIRLALGLSPPQPS